mmetsp:Transcript_25445/g.59136  ORF Transcript_25445/g.59136 Transcript_25445/m.59136 type:complete len:84 (-) Transcript_25445:10-261(-)
MLLGMPHQLRKGRQQTFDTQTIHLDKLARDQRLSTSRADRCRQNNHFAFVVSLGMMHKQQQTGEEQPAAMTKADRIVNKQRST